LLLLLLLLHVASVLQDAGLPQAKLCAAYQQLVCIVRKLYQECRLVHADLSEYNILVHKVSFGG
jgi:RIO kinase 1